MRTSTVLFAFLTCLLLSAATALQAQITRVQADFLQPDDTLVYAVDTAEVQGGGTGLPTVLSYVLSAPATGANQTWVYNSTTTEFQIDRRDTTVWEAYAPGPFPGANRRLRSDLLEAYYATTTDSLFLHGGSANLGGINFELENMPPALEKVWPYTMGDSWTTSTTVETTEDLNDVIDALGLAGFISGLGATVPDSVRFKRITQRRFEVVGYGSLVNRQDTFPDVLLVTRTDNNVDSVWTRDAGQANWDPGVSVSVLGFPQQLLPPETIDSTFTHSWFSKSVKNYVLEFTRSSDDSVDQVVFYEKPPCPTYGVSISGNATPNENTTETYAVDTPGTGATFSWTVLSGPGAIQGSSTDSTVSVNFSAAGTVELAVTETRDSGCPAYSDTLTLTVQATGCPPVVAGSVTGPSPVNWGDTAQYVLNTPRTGSTFNWNLPTGVTLISGQNNDTVEVRFDQPGSVTLTANEDSSGCPASPATLTVTVNDTTTPCPPTVTASITGSATVNVGDTGAYSLPNANPNATYTWTVPSGVSLNSGAGTNQVQLIFSSAGTQVISVTEDSANCTLRTATLTITVSNANCPPIAPGTVSGPATVNQGDTATYTANTPRTASTLSWSVSPGASIVGSSGLDTVVVVFTTPGTATVTLNEDSAGCAVQPVGQTVTVNDTSSACSFTPNPIRGLTIKSPGDTGAYRISARMGFSYDWDVSGAGAQIVGADSLDTVLVLFGSTGTATLTCTETPPGCPDIASTYTINVGPNNLAETAELSLSAYPNPVAETVTLELPEQPTAPLHLQLLDLQGRVVHAQTWRAQQGPRLTLQAADWPAGVYLLRVASNSHQQLLRLVKQ